MALLDNKPVKKEPTIKPISNWLEEEKETLLLYGGPKCGKTWAYCSYIEKCKGKVYIINTDAGLSKTFKQYFGDKSAELQKKVVLFLITDTKEAGELSRKLLKRVTSDDLIIIDLISGFWDMAQYKFIEGVSGTSPEDFIVNASKDTKKFGNFAGTMWQYITSLHDYILKPLILQTKCDVIGVCGEKDLKVEKAITGNIKDMEYEKSGSKPNGAPRLPHDFGTIVKIGKMKDKHYFQCVGVRGTKTNCKMVTFEGNFYKAFEGAKKGDKL